MDGPLAVAGTRSLQRDNAWWTIGGRCLQILLDPAISGRIGRSAHFFPVTQPPGEVLVADSERAADGLRDRITVRGEMLSDADVVHRLVTEAFQGPAEADIVRRLRGQPGVFGFVAKVGGAVAGHVVFSPATLRSRGHSLVGAALGPVAVAPAHQRRGIGGILIRRGLAQCLEDRVPFVAVVGEPEYYARFGFQPASRWNVQVEYDMPGEYFMLQVHAAGLMAGGTVHYHPAFSEEES